MRTTLVMSTLAFAGTEIEPAAASTIHDRVAASTTRSPAPQTAQQAADLGTANAAANDVQQSIAVIDRVTGELVAVHEGDRVFNAESIVKLFTAAYYLLEADGTPDAELADQLRTMIEVSKQRHPIRTLGFRHHPGHRRPVRAAEHQQRAEPE